jgi:hypothetical protein
MSDAKTALRWYKEHFRKATGASFKGSFGFRYQPGADIIDIEYKSSPKGIWIAAPSLIDQRIPLDREVADIATEAKLPEWAAPALRLVVLIGEIPEKLELRVPHRFISPLGNWRVLVHPANKVSTRDWRQTGEMLGVLPSEVDMWQVPGTITIYEKKRANARRQLYQQTMLAYQEAIAERRKRNKKGKWGLLKETARILKENYGWKYEEDSYTIRRFLDRAEKLWRISTRLEKRKG